MTEKNLNVSVGDDPDENLRRMAREQGLNDRGPIAAVVRRLRRRVHQEASRVLPPRAWRRAEPNFGKKGRKGAKARARGQRVLMKKFGRLK